MTELNSNSVQYSPLLYDFMSAETNTRIKFENEN